MTIFPSGVILSDAGINSSYTRIVEGLTIFNRGLFPFFCVHPVTVLEQRERHRFLQWWAQLLCLFGMSNFLETVVVVGLILQLIPFQPEQSIGQS